MKKLEAFMFNWPLLYLISFFSDRSVLKLGSSINVSRIFVDSKRYNSQPFELKGLILLDPALTPKNIKITENLLRKFLTGKNLSYIDSFVPLGSYQSKGGSEFIYSSALPIIKNYALSKDAFYFTDCVSQISSIMDNQNLIDSEKRKTQPAYKKYRVRGKKIYLSYSKCDMTLENFFIVFNRIIEPYILLDFILIREISEVNAGSNTLHILINTKLPFNLLPTSFTLFAKNSLGLPIEILPTILTGEEAIICSKFLPFNKINNKNIMLSQNYESLLKKN